MFNGWSDWVSAGFTCKYRSLWHQKLHQVLAGSVIVRLSGSASVCIRHIWIEGSVLLHIMSNLNTFKWVKSRRYLFLSAFYATFYVCIASVDRKHCFLLLFTQGFWVIWTWPFVFIITVWFKTTVTLKSCRNTVSVSHHLSRHFPALSLRAD